MTKLKIGIDDIPDNHTMDGYSKTDVILWLIVKYGKADALTELDLEGDFNGITAHTPTLLRNAIPFFRNIHHLRLKGHAIQARRAFRWSKYLEKFSFRNLESIEMINIITTGKWMLLSSIENLHSMRMFNTMIQVTDHFAQLVIKNPHLKSFHYEQKIRIHSSLWALRACDSYFEIVANLAPQIEEIGPILDAYRDNFEERFHPKPYINNLQNLKSIAVTSIDCNNLNQLFNRCNSVSKLEKLKIFFCYSYMNMESVQIPMFTNLMDLHLMDIQNFVEGETVLPNLMSKMPNLKTIHITGKGIRQYIIKTIVANARELRILYIESNCFQGKASKVFYTSLIKLQKEIQRNQAVDQRKPLIVYIDAVTVIGWREKIGAKYDEQLIIIKPL